MQAEPTVSRNPARAMGMIEETADERPRLACIVRDK